MFFGHLVIGNWHFVIGNLLIAICSWQMGNRLPIIGNWKKVIENCLIELIFSTAWRFWIEFGMVWNGLVWFGMV